MTGSRNSNLASLTLAEAASRLRGHQVTSVALTEACLEQIDVYNPKLDSFITVTKPQALAAASQADLEIRAGKYRGPLHGIPFAAKDNIDTAGVKTTGGSALFADRVPAGDATVIERLKAAGAVLLGKTNLQEFALGASNNSDWGPVRNPWNLLHYSGGSSSGSGAAIAAYMCYATLGTDTGGSVRIPAAYCGVVGLKPSYGLVPAGGVFPLSPRCDPAGTPPRPPPRPGGGRRAASAGPRGPPGRAPAGGRGLVLGRRAHSAVRGPVGDR